MFRLVPVIRSYGVLDSSIHNLNHAATVPLVSKNAAIQALNLCRVDVQSLFFRDFCVIGVVAFSSSSILSNPSLANNCNPISALLADMAVIKSKNAPYL